MSLFWLCYRVDGETGVLIIEASSLISARMQAAVSGRDCGAGFSEGHQLDPRYAVHVPNAAIGLMLSPPKAAAMIAAMEWPDGLLRIQKKPPATSIRWHAAEDERAPPW
jgi:hypothetical protein